jgi:hypothetical protein
VLHHFSADKHPGLYRALPALEDLQSAWESKLNDPRFDIYHDAIRDGLTKLKKYYCRFDEKPAFILALSKLYYATVAPLELTLISGRSFQCCIRILSYITSNLPGEERRNKLQNGQQEIDMPRTGKRKR